MSCSRQNCRTLSFRNWSVEGKKSSRISTRWEYQERLKAAAVWVCPIKWMTSSRTSLAKILGTKKLNTCYLLATTWASKLTLFWEGTKAISSLMKLRDKGKSKHNWRKSSDATCQNVQVEVLSLLAPKRRFPQRHSRSLKLIRQVRSQT